MLEKILNSLDLSHQESKVYIKLLEKHPISVGQLSKFMEIPRPTLYGILERLRNIGLVTVNYKSDKMVFSPEQLTKLNQIFNKRIDSLKTNQQKFQEILPTLLSNNLDISQPKFKIYNGIEGVKNILNDMLLYYDIQTYAYWPISKMIDILSPEYFRFHNVNRIRNKLRVKAIWPQNYSIKSNNHPYLSGGNDFLRKIKIAPDNIDFTMGYWIYNNKVACISSQSESFGFILESREFSQMLLSQFDYIWKNSKTYTNNSPKSKEFIDKINRKY